MNLPRPVRITLLSALFLSSCDRRKEYGIEYKESTLEQTVEAASAAFAESGEQVETELGARDPERSTLLEIAFECVPLQRRQRLGLPSLLA